jgi:hypothetical protein
MVEMSASAKKLLKHFKTRGLDQGVWEMPAKMEALFTESEECVDAQIELESFGLLELGDDRYPSEPSGVRSAALTRNGFQFLQRTQLDC